jgi:hypothetical protein
MDEISIAFEQVFEGLRLALLELQHQLFVAQHCIGRHW